MSERPRPTPSPYQVEAASSRPTIIEPRPEPPTPSPLHHVEAAAGLQAASRTMTRETDKDWQQSGSSSDEDVLEVSEEAYHKKRSEEALLHDLSSEEERDESDDDNENKKEDETMSREHALKKLEYLCHVLGLNYQKKLNEFGAGEIETKHVLEMVCILKRASLGNFKSLKRTATELLNEWKLSDTPSKRMEKFSWILLVLDASTSNDLTQKGILSTEGATRAEREVKLLRKERDQKSKSRYTHQKKRLERVLSDTHLPPVFVGYDPCKQVTGGNYISEKKKIKKIIEKVKALSQRRKEVVLRVETLKSAIQKKVTTEEVEVMIQKIQMVAKDVGGGEMPYDDDSLDDYLCKLSRVHDAA